MRGRYRLVSYLPVTNVVSDWQICISPSVWLLRVHSLLGWISRSTWKKKQKTCGRENLGRQRWSGDFDCFYTWFVLTDISARPARRLSSTRLPKLRQKQRLLNDLHWAHPGILFLGKWAQRFAPSRFGRLTGVIKTVFVSIKSHSLINWKFNSERLGGERGRVEIGVDR